MALDSVSAAETLIQSNNDNDLEDGEIPSDEDDEPVSHTTNASESIKSVSKPDSAKNKNFDSKFNKNKKQHSVQAASKHERFLKYKGPTEDWAEDVEKAIKAAMEDDGSRSQDSKAKNKNSRNKTRKRNRDEREDDRSKDQKRRKLSDDENVNEDEDEMLFVRGASPIRKDCQENNSPRRITEHEHFDNNSDYEERPTVNRHRENDNKRSRGGGGGGGSSGGSSSGGRRGGKNERGGKNKTRSQMRNDRNSRRTQNNDHGQDPDAICLYYMQGKCHRGDDCPFSHNALPPRKMELCKFYLMDCCAKRDKCLYMHHDFPCKFFHTGLKCNNGENCKFSHQPLNEQIKNILLKHLETAPKEILGDFPRLSREGAILMINNTARSLAQGQDTANQKIPSLFDLNLSAPIEKMDEKEEKEDQVHKQKINIRERKPSGKKTRWGSDEDRVPYEQVMLLQSANKLGLQLSNPALGLATQQQLQQKQSSSTINFYTETNSESSKTVHKFKEDFTKDIADDDTLDQQKKKNRSTLENSKDVDLRQLIKSKKPPPVVSIADELATLMKSKLDDESDQDEEANLIIEMPIEDEEKENGRLNNNNQQSDQLHDVSSSTEDQEAPRHLSKKTQELFMRIQQQQRAAQDSFKNMDNDSDTHHADQMVEDWYSDDDDYDDDDEGGNLTIVDGSKDEIESTEKTQDVIVKDDFQSKAPNVPQPAAIVDKLGDLSKIDISAEVSKLLSSIKAQSSSNNKTSQVVNVQDVSKSRLTQDSSDNTVLGIVNESSKIDETSNPRLSPGSSSIAMPISRDPRMSRDPRQRRDEQKPSSPSMSDSKKESKHLRLETSIYSSGIISLDTNMDTDLRTKTDQDLRRKDTDFRQRFQTSFGDTDLRVVGTTFTDVSTKSDIDLRQILSLPFKPAPSHIPCTEIDASIASHPPMVYKVYVVDIPRPDYTGLKLTKNDAQVRYDPRLRKIFRITKIELADSPMSPPPMKPETPKSPPQIRSDPRRKALEVSNQSVQNMNASMIPKGVQPQSMEMSKMGLSSGSMSGMPCSQSMLPMGPNSMGIGNMGPMGSMMGPSIAPQNMPSMGMPPSMGMNGPVMSQSQMNYDPRFNVQRNNGAGLLGPAPGPFGPDVNHSYEGGAPYPSGNFNNFVPGDPGMINFNSNGSNPTNFGIVDGPDWGTGQNRRGRMRRRNRNRTNIATNN